MKIHSNKKKIYTKLVTQSTTRTKQVVVVSLRVIRKIVFFLLSGFWVNFFQLVFEIRTKFHQNPSANNDFRRTCKDVITKGEGGCKESIV